MSEPSVNSKVRLLGEVGTSDKPSFPMPARAPAQSAAPPVSITPPPPIPVQAEPIFLGDSADGADLLNTAAVETLRHGGEVQTLSEARMPSGGPICAIFRYASNGSL